MFFKVVGLWPSGSSQINPDTRKSGMISKERDGALTGQLADRPFRDDTHKNEFTETLREMLKDPIPLKKGVEKVCIYFTSFLKRPASCVGR
ncbi:MAG: hypothetical protein PHW56_00330 [Methanosarcinaceae archaeon]|nr:hypothetical protein [Methanosarcinaceae archaeon]